MVDPRGQVYVISKVSDLLYMYIAPREEDMRILAELFSSMFCGFKIHLFQAKHFFESLDLGDNCKLLGSRHRLIMVFV